MPKNNKRKTRIVWIWWTRVRVRFQCEIWTETSVIRFYLYVFSPFSHFCCSRLRDKIFHHYNVRACESNVSLPYHLFHSMLSISLFPSNILHFLCVRLFLSFRFTTSRSSIAYRLFRSLQNGGCKRWKNDKIDARNRWNGIFNHEKLLDIIKMIGERISHPSNGISTTRFFLLLLSPEILQVTISK